jgi:dolichol-phosphate mannosyltransferase
MQASANSILVVIPTYNEIDNLAEIARRVLCATDEVDILVVDDNSPDGTGRLADRLAASTNRISVLHRPGKAGLGAAYRAGFGWGLRAGYDVLVEMDADGWRRTDQLPVLLEGARRADVVLGSRWITGGYRLFCASALIAIDYQSVAARGHRFQLELLWRARDAGLTIIEAPIDSVERVAGWSTLSTGVVSEALARVATRGDRDLRRRFRRWRSKSEARDTPGLQQCHRCGKLV